MKKLRILFVMALFTFVTVGAQAQTVNVGQLASGLVNVNIQDVLRDIQVGDITVVEIGDVDVEIRDIDITILERLVVQNVRINALNNALREARILNDSQIVVGILSDQLIFRDLN